MLAPTALRLSARALLSPTVTLWALALVLIPLLAQALSPMGSQLFAPEREGLIMVASLVGSGIGLGYLSRRRSFFERVGEVERVALQGLVLLGTSSVMIGVAGAGEVAWEAPSLLIAYRAPAIALGILPLRLNSPGLMCLFVAAGWVVPALITTYSWFEPGLGASSTSNALKEGLLTAAILGVALLTHRDLSRAA